MSLNVVSPVALALFFMLMDQRPSIHGRVVDGRHDALLGVAVRVTSIPLSGVGTICVTTSDGAFAFTDLVAGTYRLSFIHGFQGKALLVSGGDTLDLGDVVLDAEVAGPQDAVVCICDPVIDSHALLTPNSKRSVASRELHIMDSERRPVSAARVEVFGREYLDLTTDVFGRVSFEMLDGDDARVLVHHDAYRSLSTDTCCYGKRGEITLRPVEWEVK